MGLAPKRRISAPAGSEKATMPEAKKAASDPIERLSKPRSSRKTAINEIAMPYATPSTKVVA